jgi:drug/metabolite transporter (DMT)-like permease
MPARRTKPMRRFRWQDPSMHTQRSSHARVLLLVAVLTIVWGTNWVLFPLAIREVSIWTFRAVCLLGSGGLVLLVARWRGLSLFVPRKERGPLAAAALTYLIVWNVASTYSAVLLPSGQAAVLGFTMPIWATVLSWLFLRERPSARLLAAILLAGCGVCLLVFAAGSAQTSSALGFGVGLSAGIGWAAGTLMLKRAGLTVPSIVSTGWQLVIAGVPIAVVALLAGTREPFVPSWTTVLVIGYITVIPMALGNVAWFSIASMLPASVSGLSTVMVPMVAMLTGAAVRGEPLGLLELAAMACSSAAMALVLLKRA